MPNAKNDFATLALASKLPGLGPSSCQQLTMCCAAGEHGQLDEPACHVLTHGTVALLLVPRGAQPASESLENTIAAKTDQASAAALLRRISAAHLHIDTVPLQVGRASPEPTVTDGGAKQAADSTKALPGTHLKQQGKQCAQADSGGTAAKQAVDADADPVVSRAARQGAHHCAASADDTDKPDTRDARTRAQTAAAQSSGEGASWSERDDYSEPSTAHGHLSSADEKLGVVQSDVDAEALVRVESDASDRTTTEV